jgi:hypothetical protein
MSTSLNAYSAQSLTPDRPTKHHEHGNGPQQRDEHDGSRVVHFSPSGKQPEQHRDNRVPNDYTYSAHPSPQFSS